MTRQAYIQKLVTRQLDVIVSMQRLALVSPDAYRAMIQKEVPYWTQLLRDTYDTLIELGITQLEALAVVNALPDITVEL
jgi:hypothetical protein